MGKLEDLLLKAETDTGVSGLKEYNLSKYSSVNLTVFMTKQNKDSLFLLEFYQGQKGSKTENVHRHVRQGRGTSSTLTSGLQELHTSSIAD